MSMVGPFGARAFAIDAPFDARLAFIRRTYLHLAGAVVAFMILSWALFEVGVGAAILRAVIQFPYSWLLVLGAFSLVGWLGTSMARSDRPLGAQYGGLAVYTAAEALVFSPLIFIAAHYQGVLESAAGVTLLTFGGLSAYVLLTRKDFSFLGGALVVGSLVALGLIVAAVVFGFGLGIWFSGAMILLAAGAVLYTTSRVLHTYRTDQYVGAALELFAAVALLFWYILRLFLQLQRR